MDSCLKLVSCALGAISKWAHLHNKQFCEKGFGATHPGFEMDLVSGFS